MISAYRISYSAALFVFFALAFLASIFVLPVALLFCDAQAQHLPRWAFWCDNPKYGINGNLDWVTRITPFGLKRNGWLARLLWLLRNPVGYVGQRLLSVDIPASSTVLMTDPDVSDKGKEGFCLSTCVEIDGEVVWDYYLVKQWCSTRRLVIRIGWKLQHATPPKTATYVFRINPLKAAPK